MIFFVVDFFVEIRMLFFSDFCRATRLFIICILTNFLFGFCDRDLLCLLLYLFLRVLLYNWFHLFQFFFAVIFLLWIIFFRWLGLNRLFLITWKLFFGTVSFNKCDQLVDLVFLTLISIAYFNIIFNPSVYFGVKFISKSVICFFENDKQVFKPNFVQLCKDIVLIW